MLKVFLKSLGSKKNNKKSKTTTLAKTLKKSVDDFKSGRLKKNPKTWIENEKISIKKTALLKAKQAKHKNLNPKKTKVETANTVQYYSEQLIKEWEALDAYKNIKERDEIRAKLKKLARNLPKREKWLFENPEALSSVHRGILFVKLGSNTFTEQAGSFFL